MKHLAIACLTLAACDHGEPVNSLSGSIETAGYSLAFDTVRITRDGDQLVIRYEHKTVVNHQTVTNQPARLTIDPVADRELSMASDVFLEHAVTTVDVSQQPVDEADFPAVESGQLTFVELGEALGDNVAGEFTCVFSTGFTLSGEFEAELTAPP